MIPVTDIDGRTVYLHRDAIAAVCEAGVSSQWHGVRSFVRTFDGKTIEAREYASALARAIASERT